jgi:hypothetical protein
MNDITSFVELVRTLRAAQRKYFKSRAQSDLQRSMSLERQVDLQLEKLPKPEPKPEQMTLGQESPS